MSVGLIKAERLIEEFRKMDTEMQAQTMMAFLYISRMYQGETPVTVRDVGEYLGITSASASRNVAALSKWHRHGKPGHDLVEAYENPARRIEKFIRLTPKGKRVAKTLGDLFNVSKSA